MTSPYVTPGIIQNLDPDGLKKILDYSGKDKCRDRELVFKRQIIMSCLFIFGESLSGAGAPFKKNHATVLHSIDVMGDVLFVNDRLSIRMILRIFRPLYNRHKYECDVYNELPEIKQYKVDQVNAKLKKYDFANRLVEIIEAGL